MVAALSVRAPDDYRDGNDEVVIGTGQDLTSGLFKLELSPGQAHRLTFGSVNYNNEFLANSYTQRIESARYTGGYAWSPGNELIDLPPTSTAAT